MGRRTQILLVVMGSLVLTGAIIASAMLWLDRPSLLTIDAGPPGDGRHRFAERLEAVLEQTHASLRLSMTPNGGDSDLAVIRSDGKPPRHARALAVLEHDLLLIIGPRGASLKTVADLHGRRLAVLGEDGRNEALLRQILDVYQVDGTSTPLTTVGANTPIDSLLVPGGMDFVIAFEPLSRIAKTRAFEDLSQRMGGFSVFGIGDAKALERKIPGLYAEEIDAGLLSGAPRIPEEETETVALQEVLVARDDLADAAVAELMRVIFENKADLAVDHRFATEIEPPDLDKDSLIAAHDGAVQYVDSDVEDFFERYSDLIYLVMSVGSVVGSVSLALFTTLGRIKPIRAGARAHDLMEVTDRIRAAENMPALDRAGAELEALLKEVLQGLKDGSVSSDGIDAFRMGYEHSREALAERRRDLSSGPKPSRYSRPG